MDANTNAGLPPLPMRLVKVFVSPGELFTALKTKPVWFGAMAVCAILVAVSMVFIPVEVWLETARAGMIDRGQDIPPGFDDSAGIIRISSIIGGALGTPIMMFILAGVMTLVFSFILGGEGSYKQFLSVVAHASFITAVGALLLTPLKIAQGDAAVTLSLGTFFSFLGEGYLLNVLKMLDLFALWSYAVMAVGVSKMDPKRSFGFAMGFFLVFAVGFALIFANFV